jgi:hypothetical protein
MCEHKDDHVEHEVEDWGKVGNLISEEELLEKVKTRCWVTKIMTCTCIASMAVAAACAMWTGSYGPLQYTWAIVGPVVGAVIMRYITNTG